MFSCFALLFWFVFIFCFWFLLCFDMIVLSCLAYYCASTLSCLWFYDNIFFFTLILISSCNNIYADLIYVFRVSISSCLTMYIQTTYLLTEAANGGILWKKMFLKIAQNSQEKTCARVYFLIKLQVSGLQLYLKRLLHKCFPVNFADF